MLLILAAAEKGDEPIADEDGENFKKKVLQEGDPDFVGPPQNRKPAQTQTNDDESGEPAHN